jgi:peptide/nickel transport system permease protein
MLTKYILRRLIALPLTMLGVYTILFFFLYSLPTSPAVIVSGLYANQETIAETARVLGLDQPLPVQYVRYLGNIAQGSLGHSFHTRRPVTSELRAAFPATLELTAVAVLLSTLMGLPAGVISAIKRNSVFDHMIRVLSLLGWATPSFWLALIFILIFSLHLGWLPTSGRGTLRQLFLPAFTLGIVTMASIARITRANMLEVLGESYIVTARAKGLRERNVILIHALRNAFLPIVTVIGHQFGVLLTSAIFIETVFAWPGVGRLLVNAILQRDFPLIQGTVIFMGTLFLIINLIVDISYVFFDPRVRYS